METCIQVGFAAALSSMRHELVQKSGSKLMCFVLVELDPHCIWRQTNTDQNQEHTIGNHFAVVQCGSAVNCKHVFSIGLSVSLSYTIGFDCRSRVSRL